MSLLRRFDQAASIGSPNGLVHPAAGVEHGGRAAVTAVRFAPVRLVGQVWVDEGAAGGRASARWKHPGRGPVSPRHHRELVRPGRGAVVEIGRAAGLEGPALVLGGAGVRWRQVGVVVGVGGDAQRHAGGDRSGGVRERRRIVHSWTGETAFCERGQTGKLTFKLPRVGRERTEIRRTWWREKNSIQ